MTFLQVNQNCIGYLLTAARILQLPNFIQSLFDKHFFYSFHQDFNLFNEFFYTFDTITNSIPIVYIYTCLQ